MSRYRQGRLAIWLNGAVGVVVIAVIAAAYVSHKGTSTPSLSEFAPAGGQSLHLQQSAGPASEPTAVRPAAQLLAVPKGTRGVPPQLACFSWPDGTTTQTFDPQSPPCVSGWDVAHGNGGATSRGVTPTAIRVGVPRASLRLLRPYATYVSTHFQLYGRSLQLVGLDQPDLSSATGQQAAAQEAYQQQVFATLLDPLSTWGPAAVPDQYLDSAADHHVVTVMAGAGQATSTRLSALSPYAWSYSAGFDELQQAAGDLLCQVLVGRHASFSPPESHDSRRLGVVVPDAAHAGGSDVDVQTLLDALSACHSPARVEVVDPTSAAGAADALQRLKMSGVTTVVPYVGAATVARVLMPAAEQDGFRPEWVLAGIDPDPAGATWATAPRAQVRSLFGLASWGHGSGSSSRPAARVVPGARASDPAYHALLVLASGLQLAGADLTPQTFGEGLASTAFPNPGAARSPGFQAAVGFDDEDHAMVDDVALAWWRPSASAFCLVGGGTRWGFTDLPANDPGLFVPSKGCG